MGRNEIREANRKRQEERLKSVSGTGDLVDNILENAADPEPEKNEAKPVGVSALNLTLPSQRKDDNDVVIKRACSVYLPVDTYTKLKKEDTSKTKESSMTKLMETGVELMLAISPDDYAKFRQASVINGMTTSELMAVALHEFAEKIGYR